MAQWETADSGWETAGQWETAGEDKPGLIRQGLRQAGGVAAAGLDLLGSIPGMLGATPHALYDVATGEKTPTQGLEAVGEVGHALNPTQFLPGMEDARQTEAYRLANLPIQQTMQGIGNIAGAARFQGGQILGEDEAQSAQRAGELGAGAQLGLMATGPAMVGARPVSPPARAPGLRTQGVIRETYRDPATDPKAIVDKHLGRETGPELRDSAYEVPEPGVRLPIEESTADAVRRFQERGGEVREGQVITETERTTDALRRFQEQGEAPTLPPRGQTGAIGHLDRLSALERDLLKYQDELRDAKRREEKDTAKYFEEAIEEVKDTMADLRAKYEETPQPPIDPFKGPGRRQTGALMFDSADIAAASGRVREAFDFIKKRWPRFAEIKDINVIDNEKFVKHLKDKGFSDKDLNWILGYWDHGTNKVVVTDRLGSYDISNIIDLMAHELRHAFDAPRKPWRANREYWGNPKGDLTNEQYRAIPAERKAIAAGAAATNRYYAGDSGPLPRGPGRKQMGALGDLTDGRDVFLRPGETLRKAKVLYGDRDVYVSNLGEKIRGGERYFATFSKEPGKPLDRMPSYLPESTLEFYPEPVAASKPKGRSSQVVKDQLLEAETILRGLSEEYRQKIRPSDELIPELEEAQNLVRQLNNEYLKVIAQEERAMLAGPGRKQSGMILSRGRTVEKPRTEFEREENLPAGAGLSLPDTNSPVMRRLEETLEIGKDLNVEAGTPSKVELPNDIGVLGKYGLTAEHLSKFYHQNPLIKRIVDGVSEITARFGNLKEDLMKGSELLGKGGISALKYIKRGRTGFTSIADNLNKTDYISLQKAWLEFDNSPLLREANLEYPTREMLAERGYNQKTIDAYLAEAQYMKAIYTLINEARAKSGKPPIAFLPGHFPHTYKGNTGIKIIRRVMEDGVPRDVTVGYTRTTGSQKQINKVMQSLMEDIRKKLQDENHPPVDLRAEQARTDKPGNLSDVLDAFETVQEIYSHSDKPFIQLIKKVLDNRVSSMEQQFLQAALHRTGLPGWIGYTGVTQKNVNQIRQARTNYINSAIDYARSQEILAMMNEIHPTAWKEVTNKLPNTAHYVERFIEVARDRVPLNEADRAVFDVIDKFFRGRLGYRAPLAGAQGARGFFSVMDLGWSVAYHVANLFQPTVYGPAALLRESSRIGKGDVTSSILKGELGFARPSLKDKRAMEYAAKHKIITPRLMEEIDFLYRESVNKGKAFFNELVTGRRGSELNEAAGRARMYLQAYHYYESAGFNSFQAMRAAGKLVNDVMVDYGRTGQNLWLSNNPFGSLAGKMVAPYAQFQFSHWGHIALALQGIKRNPASAKAWLPFIELQAAGVLFAGIRGVTGFAAAEVIWEAYNQLYEAASGEKRKWSSLRSMLMESGANDVAMFGALSAAAGHDIGSSMAAPELTGMVNFRQVQGAYDIVTNTFAAFGKILLNKNIPDSEKYKALKAITPSRFHGYLETAFQTDSGMVGDPSNRMRGQFHRTPGSEQMRIITNKRTTAEEKERLISRTMMDESRKGRERKGDIVELAADALDEGESLSPELLRRAQEEGYKPSDFRDAVKTLRRERERTRVQKFLQGKEATRQREMMRRRFQELTDDAEFEAYR